MRVYKKMTADEIQKLMFGPIQEAARKAYGDQFEYGELPPEEDDEEEPEPEPLPPPPPPPPTPPKEPERVTGPLEWCDLSELRLTMLVCEFKPVGVNRNFHLQAIMARMHNVFEHEPIQAKMFLAGDDSAVFYEKVKERVVSGKVHDQKKPFASFPPRYGCRPTLEMIEDKLNSWFGMSICEENESYPTGLCEVTDFRLPKAILEASGEEQEGNGKKGEIKLRKKTSLIHHQQKSKRNHSLLSQIHLSQVQLQHRLQNHLLQNRARLQRKALRKLNQLLLPRNLPQSQLQTTLLNLWQNPSQLPNNKIERFI
uniref:Uncharacterized protein n=1 Tax=Caenorhabditis tropicalis TaxID=1561998 RepID=A0A1I7TJW3_9PELO